MNNAEPQGMVKLCGLWKNETKAGKTYYSGNLTYSTNILIFPNEYKEGHDNRPDVIAYIARKEEKKKPENQDLESGEPDDQIPF